MARMAPYGLVPRATIRPRSRRRIPHAQMEPGALAWQAKGARSFYSLAILVPKRRHSDVSKGIFVTEGPFLKGRRESAGLWYAIIMNPVTAQEIQTKGACRSRQAPAFIPETSIMRYAFTISKEIWPSSYLRGRAPTSMPTFTSSSLTSLATRAKSFRLPPKSTTPMVYGGSASKPKGA